MAALFPVGFPTLPFLYMSISYLGNNNNNTTFITSELSYFSYLFEVKVTARL